MEVSVCYRKSLRPIIDVIPVSVKTLMLFVWLIFCLCKIIQTVHGNNRCWLWHFHSCFIDHGPFSESWQSLEAKKKKEMFCFLFGYVSKLSCSSCLCYDLSEYCTSRAVPNIQSSGYLNTLGAKLLPGIDVMWTGRFGHSGNVCYKKWEWNKSRPWIGYYELRTRVRLDCHQQLQQKFSSWVTVRTCTIKI